MQVFKFHRGSRFREFKVRPHFRSAERFILFALLGSLSSALYAFRPIITENRGDKILDKQRETHAVDSEVAELRLSSIDSSGNVVTREFLTAFERQGTKVMGLIIFTQPSSIRGTVLVAENDTAKPNEAGPDVHIYLPAVKRTQKIAQAMPGQQSFFGSEFTWEDVMLESLTPQKATWLRSTSLHEKSVDVVELTPLSGPDYLRESRQLFIDKNSYNTLRVDVYARGTQLLKTLTAFDYASPDVNGSSKRPHRLVAQNISSMETSVLTLLSAQQNIDIVDTLFLPENLEKLSSQEASLEMLIDSESETEE